MKELVMQLINRLPVPDNSRVIIGIDGMSRSGKTTIAAELMQHYKKSGIPVICFHLDDFIVEKAKRYETGEEPWREYYQLQWDTVWLREHFFQQLKDANELALPFYDGDKDLCETREVSIPPSCMVIVEGVFLQRAEWHGCCDYVVYVDSPQTRRFERENAAVQQQLEKFSQRYGPAEDYYATNFQPRKSADFIVQN